MEETQGGLTRLSLETFSSTVRPFRAPEMERNAARKQGAKHSCEEEKPAEQMELLLLFLLLQSCSGPAPRSLSPDPAASSSWQRSYFLPPPAGPELCTSCRSPGPGGAEESGVKPVTPEQHLLRRTPDEENRTKTSWSFCCTRTNWV